VEKADKKNNEKDTQHFYGEGSFRMNVNAPEFVPAAKATDEGDDEQSRSPPIQSASCTVGVEETTGKAGELAFKVGDKVFIQGLTTRWALNGRRATVLPVGP